MLSTILQFLLSIVIQIANIILTIFISPIIFLMERIFPSFGQASSIFNEFLIDYAAPGIAFARELFLNVTGYPRDLLTTLALIYAAKLTYHLAAIPVRFAIRLIAYIFKLPDQVNNSAGINYISK